MIEPDHDAIEILKVRPKIEKKSTVPHFKITTPGMNGHLLKGLHSYVLFRNIDFFMNLFIK